MSNVKINVIEPNEDFNFVSKEVYDSRYSICKACEFLNSSGDLEFCGKCDCIIPVLVFDSNKNCPLLKW